MDEIEAARNALWNEPLPGEEAVWREQLLEQYKLYVELADRNSQRRATTNAFFATVNAALLTALATFIEQAEALASTLVPLVGITLCALWALLLRSYRSLNTAKFKVIGLMEERLPSSPWWRAEWQMLGEGKKLSLHLPLSPIETLVPLVFAIFYGIVMQA